MSSANERLVCHACGFKLPVGAMTSASTFDCCAKPDVHVHYAHAPCDLCRDEPASPPPSSAPTRRGFLRAVGLGIAALFAGRIFKPRPAPQPERDIAAKWALAAFGTPILFAPRKYYRVINIGEERLTDFVGIPERHDDQEPAARAAAIRTLLEHRQT